MFSLVCDTLPNACVSSTKYEILPAKFMKCVVIVMYEALLFDVHMSDVKLTCVAFFSSFFTFSLTLYCNKKKTENKIE